MRFVDDVLIPLSLAFTCLDEKMMHSYLHWENLQYINMIVDVAAMIIGKNCLNKDIYISVRCEIGHDYN
jgi:hypothetical protein